MKIKFPFIFLSSIVLLTTLIACRKDDINPTQESGQEPYVIQDDDYRWQYVGEWEFVCETFTWDYMWYPDSTGGGWVNNSHTDTNWIDTGEVKMGIAETDILIKKKMNHEFETHFVTNSGGLSIENHNCGHSNWSISAENYYHNWNPESSNYGGSYYTVTTVKGVKL